MRDEMRGQTELTPISQGALNRNLDLEKSAGDGQKTIGVTPVCPRIYATRREMSEVFVERILF
jgi:hypothetical protein